MKFNVRKAIVMGVVGIFASLPLNIMYALLPGVLNLSIYTNIDSWYLLTLTLAIVFFFWGSQMKS